MHIYTDTSITYHTNGCLQVFLKRRNAHLVQSAKGRNTYSDHSISCSGFRVKIHGNLCYHYKSFVGRDYKAWSQMALFIISPYIGEGERKVLLALSKVSTQCILSECVSHMVLHYFW